jgi:hypothetical protein
MFVGFVVGGTVLVGVPGPLPCAWRSASSRATVGTYSIMNRVLSRTISTAPEHPRPASWAAHSPRCSAAGGPGPHATYLSGRLRDKNQIRATIYHPHLPSRPSRGTVVYAVSGLLAHAALFVGAPGARARFVWIGLCIGQRIHVGLTQEQMRRSGRRPLLVATGLSPAPARACFQ